MRIAVFGDVHANLPALTALIEDVSRIGADAMYCEPPARHATAHAALSA